MKKLTQLIAGFLLLTLPLQAQIAFQGFEGTGNDNWNFSLNIPSYNNNSSTDLWTSYTSAIGTLGGPYEGTTYWVGRDLDNPYSEGVTGDTTPDHYMDFSPIYINGAAVTLSIWCEFEGYDSSDFIFYELFYDNGNDWSSPDVHVDINAKPSPSNASSAGNTWEEFTYDIPAGNTYVRLRIGAHQNGASDYLALDNISLSAAGCNEPDEPTVTVSSDIVSSGASVNLNISGNLNDATNWHVYTSSCGGTPVTSAASSPISVSPPDGVTTYYVRGEGGCATPGNCGSVTVYVENTITTTYSGGVWSNGVPNGAYNVVISDDFTSTENMEFYSLTIDGGNDFTLDGHTLDLTGDLTLENGCGFLDNGTLNLGGNAIIKRSTSSEALTDFHLLSFPISNGNIEASLQGSYAYRYNAGYTNIYAFENSATVRNGEGLSVSGTGSAGITRIFEGTPNNGTIVYNLISSDQWHLLGNPYPAQMELNAFYTANSATVLPTFYFYNEATGAYDTWNTNIASGTGSATANAAIAQAFFVQEVNSSASAVTYTPSMRVLQNDIFLREASNTMGYIKLRIDDETNQQTETIIAWNETAQIEKDENDALFLQGANPIGLFSALDEENYIIQSLNENFQQHIIPLGFYSHQGGTHHLDLPEANNTDGIACILVDHLLNITHNFADGAYEFVSPASNDYQQDRFSLVLMRSRLSIEDDTLQANDIVVIGGDALQLISSEGLPMQRIVIYDTKGAIISQQLLSGTNYFQSTSSLATGIYLIEIGTPYQTFFKKVYLK